MSPETSRPPISRGEPTVLRGNPKVLTEWVVTLSDDPSRAWRAIFANAAETNRLVSVIGPRLDRWT